MRPQFEILLQFVESIRSTDTRQKFPFSERDYVKSDVPRIMQHEHGIRLLPMIAQVLDEYFVRLLYNFLLLRKSYRAKK